MKEACFNGILLFEHLHHELRLNLIQLLQRNLQAGRSSYEAPLRMPLRRKEVRRLSNSASLSFLLPSETPIWTFSAYLCTSLRVSEACPESPELNCWPARSVNLADEFGIEKASVSGLRLICLGLKHGESSWTVVQARGGSVGTSQRKGGYDYGSGQESHLVPHEQLVSKTCKFSGSMRDARLISASDAQQDFCARNLGHRCA